jgi:hypothetical protein
VLDTARALQDALKARQDAQYALGLEQSKPFAARNAAQEETLKAKLRATTEDYQRQEERVAGAISAYGCEKVRRAKLRVSNPRACPQLSQIVAQTR